MNHRTSITAGLLGLGVSLVISAPWTLAQGTDTTPAPTTPGTAATTPPSTDTAPRRIRLNRPGGAGADSGQLADALKLTADQRPKFDSEMQSFQDKMRALRDEHDRALSGILTPDQMTQYRAMPQGRGFGGAGGGPGGNGGGRGFRMDPAQMVQQMKTDLNLTSDQETQITKILQDSQSKMQALRTGTSAGGDQTAMRDQMRTIRQEQNDKISALLTADQRTKWQASQQNRRGGGGGGRRGGGGGNNAPQ